MEQEIITQTNPETKQTADSINIPDIWHLAMQSKEADKEAILKVWHLCHSLLNHIKTHSK